MTDFEEMNTVPDESEESVFGLTMQELKHRLKHIAGLCYSLSCDISNVEIEAELLRAENTYLRNRLKEVGIKAPPPLPKTLNGYKKRLMILKNRKCGKQK